MVADRHGAQKRKADEQREDVLFLQNLLHRANVENAELKQQLLILRSELKSVKDENHRLALVRVTPPLKSAFDEQHLMAKAPVVTPPRAPLPPADMHITPPPRTPSPQDMPAPVADTEVSFVGGEIWDVIERFGAGDGGSLKTVEELEALQRLLSGPPRATTQTEYRAPMQAPSAAGAAGVHYAPVAAGAAGVHYAPVPVAAGALGHHYAEGPSEPEQKRPERNKITREQLAVLVKHFDQEPLPSYDHRESLAKMLGMTPRSVQIWFQNRRQRLKPAAPKARDDAPAMAPAPVASA